jgi:UDP:flavonoid glycosyltransferase YjiC (YdhE family)
MRVLITTTGSDGHSGPLIPFADALRDAGDAVLVATRESSVERVRATGFEVWPFADAPAEERAAIFAAIRDLPLDEANLRAGTEVFAGLDVRAALPGVLDACAVWRPHVVLAEVAEFAGLLAGGHLGIPVVTAAISLASTEQRVMDAIRRALGDVRAERGLDAGAPPAAHFTLAPPLLEDPVAPGPDHVRRFRERDGRTPAPLPAWWDGAGDPLVYVTLGSVAPQRDAYYPALYRAAIDALAPLPVRVLVTVGRDRDPADLGPLPANVHVERWIPQADVLQHAAAIVCHGGFGTVRGALQAGVPVVALPLFADQPYNARRVAEIGAGIALEEGPSGIGEAVRAVLADERYAERAAEVAADVRALPTVDAAVGVLRDLAGTARLPGDAVVPSRS